MSDARTHIIEEIGRLYEKLADVRKRRKKGSGTRDPTSPRGDGNPRLILACRKLPFELVRAAGETNWTGRTPEDQETDQILSNLQVSRAQQCWLKNQAKNLRSEKRCATGYLLLMPCGASKEGHIGTDHLYTGGV
eukprot:scaffold2011_cov233-Pinguiococcus_pyrenoidosus.AAC.2